MLKQVNYTSFWLDYCSQVAWFGQGEVLTSLSQSPNEWAAFIIYFVPHIGLS